MSRKQPAQRSNKAWRFEWEKFQIAKTVHQNQVRQIHTMYTMYFYKHNWAEISGKVWVMNRSRCQGSSERFRGQIPSDPSIFDGFNSWWLEVRGDRISSMEMMTKGVEIWKLCVWMPSKREMLGITHLESLCFLLHWKSDCLTKSLLQHSKFGTNCNVSCHPFSQKFRLATVSGNVVIWP